ncbi:MAG: acyl-CoA dehydrogenase [Chlorobi bacterium]|nr:acyl-CoA dehydrogenase [Chlorobiota bacterium]
MDFDLSEEHQLIREATREFAEQVLAPGVIERDEKAETPKEILDALGQQGLMGLMVKPEYGGSGLDNIAYAIVMEEIARVDAGVSVYVTVQNSLVNWGIQEYGTEEQKKKYLPLLASGEWIGAFCLSEPEAGSDATHQRTTAIKKGDHYVLNGIKNWISSAGKASLFVVIAQSDPSKGYKGINAFIVERDWKGITIGPKENKMGIRSSDTHSVIFEDVIVPEENRIGPEGFGFKFAMNVLNGGRIGIAAQAVGIAQGAYERARQYATERIAFGVPIAEHQAIRFKLADMATRIEAARLLTWRAAWLKDQHLPYAKESAMAKLFAADTAMFVTREAVQIHGGYGYVREYHVERMMRDAKITEIYEGTSEIQKIVISRSVLKE